MDLVYEGGLEYSATRLGDTAEYGDYYAGPQIIDEHVKEIEMQGLLNRIQAGEFAEEWLAENAAGRERFLQMRSEAQVCPEWSRSGRNYAR